MTSNQTKTIQISPNQKAFGIKYPLRNQLPSMFQILSWDTSQNQKLTLSPKIPPTTNNQQKQKSPQVIQHYKTNYFKQYPNDRLLGDKQKVIQQIKQNKAVRTKSHAHLIKNQLYIEDPLIKYQKRSPLSNDDLSPKKKKKKATLIAKSSKPKIQKNKQKLDQNKDKQIIKRRQQRIKQFNLQSRNLPNSAFVTYYGKPAFENYGRNNTKSTVGGICYGQYLHTHNVMPHKGANNPKNIQTYKTALMNAQKFKKTTSQLPRKKDEHYVHDRHDKRKSQTHSSNSPQRNVYHYDLVKPDLINAERFASQPSTPQKSERQHQIIPRPKTGKIQKQNIQPIKKTVNFVQPNQKTKRNVDGKKQEGIIKKSPQKVQRLKFMNTRQDFIDELNQKKNKKNRLAYKVTQCYPVVRDKEIIINNNEEISDPKDYKNIDLKWKTLIPAAGKVTAPHVDIKQVFVFHK